nr:hypothetical protein [Tanacetum cinerariifolium]
NGDQPLPIIAQVSLAGTAQNAPSTHKDPKFWTAEEKKTQKIDRLARSLLIQGLLNDIYSLIDSNEMAKDLWDALERQMCGSEYGEQDRKAAILYEYETFKAPEGEKLLDTCLITYEHTKNLIYINIDALYNNLKQNQGDVNDALGYKKKAVMVTSDPLPLVAEKINNDKKADDKKRDMSKVKCYNCKKEGHFDKDCKKVKVKDYNYYKTKMLLAKKDSDEQVLLESDESSSSAKETIAKVAYYTSESESEYEFKTKEYYDNSTNYGLFVNNNDDQEIFHDAIESASENFIENHIDSQNDYVKSEVDHNDSEEKEYLVDKFIRKFNLKIAKLNTFEVKSNEFKEQINVLNEKNADLLDQTKVLKDQLQVKHVVIDTHIADQEVLFDKMSVQLVELDKHVRDLKNMILEKDFKISELEECVRNKDLEIEKCLERLNLCEKKIHKMGQTNQTVHMIMPFKDILYNGQKGLGFKNPRYFEKAKDLRPSLYHEKVIGLGYTLMFLTHSDEALEIEKFKRLRENKIEFAYDYGNLNASYVNEKINFEDDYFQKIINPNFEKIDSPFQQTSSLKPYVSNVILEKIIIDLEDEVENPKVIAPGMFKLSVSQSVSPMSMSKTSCDSKNVENTFSSVRRPKHSSVVWKKNGSSNTSNVDLFSDSHLKLNKDVKRYSRKDLMCDLLDDNNFFIFDDESVKISPVSKMPFRKKPHDSMNIVQIYLWIIDSGCSNHMTGNRTLLTNFVEKFLGMIRFGNNDFAVIVGYGDVGLEVAFRKSTCFVRNEDGVDLLTDDRSLNLYTIALKEVASNSSTSSSQSWLWHQRLSHLNFTKINNLVKNNLVKDHFYSACEQGKIHPKHQKSKTAF